ncbi:tRNA guanosine(34) transglycosylase Tgt [Parasediminibacterium sp. JCM 36343]|uniref:tRNA guanosine(34) transglycosylase Tgt n=1 Tax=Parasediminibacterium sp. JCM 36343 TaxID=3374279 RepID=UPI00397A7F1C
MAALAFNLQHTDTQSKARVGTITTDHGIINTPIFMPVGTVGSVKAVTQAQLKEEIQAQIILGNTYHLYLRPGTEVLEAAGGLHKFNGWDRPILTDSGGYQVFSLAANRKINEEGVLFQSHIDGSRHLFTPEKVMDIQRSIGGDIIMAFDECPPYPSEYIYAKKSMELTHRWLDRCFKRLGETPDKYGYTQNLFPIIQGSTYKDLRTASAEYVASQQSTGNAIGGLSVGEPEQMMYEFAELCCDILPVEKPRYLMGVGTPWNILENIAIGVDMFDCVMPTRNGRNGMLFTSKGIINIRNKKWATDFSCIDDGIPCPTSQYYSKGYLRHLFVANEILALQIASIHNLAFYLWLVTEARAQILDNNFVSWKNDIIPVLKQRL